jgi:hypothetical protein
LGSSVLGDNLSGQYFKTDHNVALDTAFEIYKKLKITVKEIKKLYIHGDEVLDFSKNGLGHYIQSKKEVSDNIIGNLEVNFGNLGIIYLTKNKTSEDIREELLNESCRLLDSVERLVKMDGEYLAELRRGLKKFRRVLSKVDTSESPSSPSSL